MDRKGLKRTETDINVQKRKQTNKFGLRGTEKNLFQWFGKIFF